MNDLCATARENIHGMNIKLFRKRSMVKSETLANYEGLMHGFGGLNDTLSMMLGTENSLPIYKAEQTHSSIVKRVRTDRRNYLKCDALISSNPGFVTLKTADCIPIIIYDPIRKKVAAIHAGWKGLFSGVIINTFLKLKGGGSRIKDLRIVTGPHIRVCCYSVSEKRIQLFTKKGYPESSIVNRIDGIAYLNLSAIMHWQLKKAGIEKEQTDSLEICTCCDDHYHSYRRDGEKAGRNYSFIGRSIL